MVEYEREAGPTPEAIIARLSESGAFTELGH